MLSRSCRYPPLAHTVVNPLTPACTLGKGPSCLQQNLPNVGGAPSTKHLRPGPAPHLCSKAGSKLPYGFPDNLSAPRALLPGPGDLGVNSPYRALQQVISQAPALLLTSGDVHTANLNLLRPSSLAAVRFCARCPLSLQLLVPAVTVLHPPLPQRGILGREVSSQGMFIWHNYPLKVTLWGCLGGSAG